MPDDAEHACLPDGLAASSAARVIGLGRTRTSRGCGLLLQLAVVLGSVVVTQPSHSALKELILVTSSRSSGGSVSWAADGIEERGIAVFVILQREGSPSHWRCRERASKAVTADWTVG